MACTWLWATMKRTRSLAGLDRCQNPKNLQNARTSAVIHLGLPPPHQFATVQPWRHAVFMG